MRAAFLLIAAVTIGAGCATVALPVATSPAMPPLRAVIDPADIATPLQPPTHPVGPSSPP